MPGGLGLTNGNGSCFEKPGWIDSFNRVLEIVRARMRRERGPWLLEELEHWIIEEFQPMKKVAEFVLRDLQANRVLIQDRELGTHYVSQICHQPE
jgi:hypothetical protein